MCRVIVKYRCERCRKSWISQRGRLDPREDRVEDQYCSKCIGYEVVTIVSYEFVSEEALLKLQGQRNAAQSRVREEATWTGRQVSAEALVRHPAQHHVGTYAIGTGLDQPWSGRVQQWSGRDQPHMGSGKGAAKGYVNNGDSGKGSPSTNRAVVGTIAVEEAPSHQTIVPRLATQEHRPELCEPCRKWGDCSGWFADPFFVFAAAMFLLDDEDVDDHDLSWQEGNVQSELRAEPLRKSQLQKWVSFLSFVETLGDKWHS